MEKRISITLTLLFVMSVMSMFPVNAESKIITSGDWSYIITEESAAEVLSYNGSETELIVPDELDGYKVKNISFAFPKQTVSLRLGKNINAVNTKFITKSASLQSITVNSDNRTFGSKNGLLLNYTGNKIIAYPGGKNDKTISLPEAVEYIGKSAYEGNASLQKIIIPKNIKYIGAYAFSGCKNVKLVKIAKNVKTIKNGAFSFCKKLTNIKIENNENLKMGSFVFGGCSALAEATLPEMKNTKGNGSGIFAGCENLEKLSTTSEVKFIPTNCCGGCKLLKTILLSTSVRKIAEGAFDSCINLKKINISKKIKKIENEAFYNCKKMKSVKIPLTVKSIGAYAFGYKNIGGNDYRLNNEFIIMGKKGSAAEKYAKANKLKFKVI